MFFPVIHFMNIHVNIHVLTKSWLYLISSSYNIQSLKHSSFPIFLCVHGALTVRHLRSLLLSVCTHHPHSAHQVLTMRFNHFNQNFIRTNVKYTFFSKSVKTTTNFWGVLFLDLLWLQQYHYMSNCFCFFSYSVS